MRRRMLHMLRVGHPIDPWHLLRPRLAWLVLRLPHRLHHRRVLNSRMLLIPLHRGVLHLRLGVLLLGLRRADVLGMGLRLPDTVLLLRRTGLSWRLALMRVMLRWYAWLGWELICHVWRGLGVVR